MSRRSCGEDAGRPWHAVALSIGVAMLLLLGLPELARGQEWFDDYDRARTLIANGQAEQAIPLLERAIRRRPEPGTNILTYGTNRLDEYHPYLTMADARLRMGDLEQPAEALASSGTAGIAPAELRQALAARLAAASRAAAVARENDAARSREPPAPPVSERPPGRPSAPAPDPDPATRIGTLQVRTEPEGASVVANNRLLGVTPLTIRLDAGDYEVSLRKDGWQEDAVAVTLAPNATFVLDRSLRARSAPAPVAAAASAVPAPPTRESGPAAQVASLVVVTHPSGSSVYLDDEPLGSTDPETGRLVKSDVPVGIHRLRVSRPDHLDRVTELDLVAGDPTVYETTLERVSAPVAAPGVSELAPVALTPSTPSGPGWGVTLVLIGLAGVVGSLVLLGGTRKGREWGASIGRTVGLSDRFGWGRRAARRAVGGGEEFGGYELLDLLGRGGMAEVYRATRDGEVCALKRPLERFLEQAEFRQRFLREAEIGRTLHHPNIIRILDRGEVDRVPYFTMEIVAGETLRSRLADEVGLPARTATAIVLQVAEALDYAHSKGIVHRDVTTANVMVQPDGSAKVMDYGIASARRFSGLTVTGAFMGTPDYVAPEVAAGLTADARSDLYSLGVIFFELLTGQRPFKGDTPLATLNMHREQAPVPPSELIPTMSPELDAMVLRLLAKVPDERYSTAEALLIDLREYQNRRS